MKDTWFIYLRAPRAERLSLLVRDEEGTPLKQRVKRYIPLEHPLACVCVKAQPPAAGQQRLVVGMSVWNPLDVYNRAKARGLALKRAFREPQDVVVPADATYYDANRLVLTHFRTAKLPARVRKALTAALGEVGHAGA